MERKEYNCLTGEIKVIQLTAEDIAALPAPKPLIDRQAERWEKIKEKRSEVKHGGIFVSGKWFHTDEESRSQYATMYAAISVNTLPDIYSFDTNWKTMDRSIVSMTVALLKAIITAGMESESANYANAEAHHIAMEASATPETYDFSTGWTANYA